MGAAVYGRSRAWALPYGAPISGVTDYFRANEPAGMSFLDERPYNALDENASPHSPAWDTDPPPALTIITDATAPHSPSNVLRFTYPGVGDATYPNGFVAGSAPGHTGTQWAGATGGGRTIYIYCAVKYSSGWQGQSAGTNKIWYAKVDPTAAPGGAPFFISGWGAGAGALVVKPVMQNCVVGNGVYDPNQGDPTVAFTRGQWDQLEVVLDGNTAGTADGTCDVWLNGVKTHHITGIQYTTPLTAWNLFEHAPVWGGTGGINVQVTQTLDIDHTYISRKNL